MSRTLLVIPWALAALVIVLSGHTYVLPYALVLGAFLVVLGRVPGYRDHPSRPTYDTLFLIYLWVIVAVRCRPFRWSAPVELVLNIVEHLGFALVIGLLAYLIYSLLFHWRPRKALIAAVVSFNVLGFGIEFYQDAMSGDVLQGFDADAWKDVGINAVGSALLYLILARSQRTDQTPVRA